MFPHRALVPFPTIELLGKGPRHKMHHISDGLGIVSTDYQVNMLCVARDYVELGSPFFLFSSVSPFCQ